MCDNLEQKTVFYACVIPFLLFFASFALIIYPNIAVLHPHAFVDQIASHLPAGFGAPLAIVRNWSFALFYVLAEMWGSVVTSLLFWGFANEVTTVDEAKKYCEFAREKACANDFTFSLTPVCRSRGFTRSTVWYGRECCFDLFRTICQVGIQDASESCPGR